MDELNVWMGDPQLYFFLTIIYFFYSLNKLECVKTNEDGPNENDKGTHSCQYLFFFCN
jgi:hypothetical protein